MPGGARGYFWPLGGGTERAGGAEVLDQLLGGGGEIRIGTGDDFEARASQAREAFAAAKDNETVSRLLRGADGHTETGSDGGVETGQTRTGVDDAPRNAVFVERGDGFLAKGAYPIEKNERPRLTGRRADEIIGGQPSDMHPADDGSMAGFRLVERDGQIEHAIVDQGR